MKYLYPTLFCICLLACSEKQTPSQTETNVPNAWTLPQPTGEYPVGTQKFELTDDERFDILNPSKNRVLVGQIWYPGIDRKGEMTPYIDQRLVNHMKSISYYNLSEGSLDSLNMVGTNSILNASMIKEKLPIVFFSHGLGSPKEFHTILYEDLASHGFAVISIDHPYGGMTLTKEGVLISGEMDTLTSYEPDAIHLAIAEWSKDISLVLEKISDPQHELYQKFGESLDFEKIAAGGHSLGGNVALGLDQYLTNLKGAFNMDGGSFANVEDNGMGIPSLFVRSHPIYSDEELEKKGRTRESWDEMGNAIGEIYTRLFEKTNQNITCIQIKGTGHFSYSDAPYMLPYLITFFGGKILDKNITKEISHYYILSFLNEIFDKNNSFNIDIDPENVIVKNYN